MSLVFKTRTQLVVEAIRNMILQGEIKAGEPIRQAKLANDLNVSRIPVREALLQLEAEGLVDFEAHKGATASEVSADQVDELFALRALLESELLRYSLPKLTKADLANAEDLLTQMESNMAGDKPVRACGEMNKQFHHILYSRANRPQTAELVDTLNKNASRYVRMFIQMEGGEEATREEHRQLLKLCAAGEIDAACDFLQQHILKASKDIKATLVRMEQE